MNITHQAEKLCIEHNARLLYLTKFGSHLYGTDTPDSDTDYKGIFLPSKKSCFLGKMPKSITRSTGDPGGKNSKDDVDIQLWSLQYFLELVSKGETNALDLLYSHTNSTCIEFMQCHSSGVDILDVLVNHHELFDIKDCKAYTGYAIGQAKKYGIKGSRLGVVKRIYNWIVSIKDPGWFEERTLNDLMSNILTNFHHDSYCFEKEINGARALVLCGKCHLANISATEFINRIKKDYEQYGERARQAENNEGIDWKALSHAVRALHQMIELIDTGKIQYPLKTADTIKKIKAGELDFKTVEDMISQTLSVVDKMLVDIEIPINKKNPNFIKNLILSFYNQGV